MLDDYSFFLKLISENGNFLELLNKEISMPNIPFPTMGGKVMWNTIAEYNGWKLQQNMITQHARILDANDIRGAWGTISAMEKAMKRIAKSAETYGAQDSSQSRMNAMEELKKLKELLDIGAINKEEFEQKKAELMKKI